VGSGSHFAKKARVPPQASDKGIGLAPPDRADLRVLIAVAAPKEAAAVLSGLGSSEPVPERWVPIRVGAGLDLVVTGVGKVNAALAAARAVDPALHAWAINTGICGALPGSGLQIGSVVLASESLYADEGSMNPDGFRSIAAMGFPPGGAAFVGMGVRPDPALAAALRPLADVEGVIATVSTCSGTDALAADVAGRSAGGGGRAIGEAMEGAAFGHAVAALFGSRVAFAEIRAVSNTTGDRDRQVWDLAAGLAGVERIVRGLVRVRGAT
jgi:futalosine hydrolase